MKKKRKGNKLVLIALLIIFPLILLINLQVLKINFTDLSALEEIKSEISYIKSKAEITKPSVVLFVSNWCGNCDSIIQDLKIITENKSINFYLADLEDARELGNDFGVVLSPSVVIVGQNSETLYKEVTQDSLNQIDLKLTQKNAL